MPNDIVHVLHEASRDLLYPSESEFPFEAFVWEHEAERFTERDLLRLGSYPEDASVGVEDLERFFRNVAVEQDWHGEAERRDVRNFQKLKQVLKETLADIRVFRVGRVEIDIYVVGRSATGRWAGLKTKVVET